MRFGRKLRRLPAAENSEESPEIADKPRAPALCPDFLIETYLDYQVRGFPAYSAWTWRV